MACAGTRLLPLVWTGCWKELLAQARIECLVPHSFSDLDFADDVTLLAELLELEMMASETASLGLEMNCQKTSSSFEQQGGLAIDTHSLRAGGCSV